MVTRTKTAPAPTPALFPHSEPTEPQLPADTRLRAASSIEWLRASTIGTDRRVNTREVDQGWVDAKSRPDTFKWDFLGTVAVSQRDDGSRIAVDGQHRIALVTAVAGPDADLKCEVFEGLSLAQEAALFMGLNAGRTIRPVSLFLAKVTMGDPVCTDILQIVEDCSWTIAATPGRGVLGCISALTRIHTRDIARNTAGGFEPQALRDTLTLLTTAWGQHEQTAHESLITGLGNLMVREGQVIRDDLTGGVSGMNRLLRVLEESGDNPGGLLAKAKAFQGTRVPQVGLPKAVSEILRQSWNYGKQTRRLGAFVS